MPTYSYICSACSVTFEAFRSVSKRKDPAECPECGSTESEQIINYVPNYLGTVGELNRDRREAVLKKRANEHAYSKQEREKRSAMVKQHIDKGL